MPTTTTTTSTTAANATPEIVHRLNSADQEVKLKALRELKNQIIGNRTKKLSFLKLGVVPVVADILSDAVSADSNHKSDILDDGNSNNDRNIIVQSAAVLGSFACGFDAGVRAVLDTGVFANLSRLLSNPNEKVVDAGARSLRMIYQSKLAPKYDFFQEKNMEFLLSILSSENENVSGLGASIITHSCNTSVEQKLLYDAGVLKQLTSLLEGSLSQRDASLESLATVFKNNPEVVLKFVGPESGRSLSSIIQLTKDKFSRTRLLASMCLIIIRNTCPCYMQDKGIKTKLIRTLLELLDDPGQVGDEAPFAFSSLIAEKEDLQKLGFTEFNAIDKLFNHLKKVPLNRRRFEGVLLALADMCSKLECCRSRFLSLQVLDFVVDALAHDSADVRTAACICIKSVSRSIKNLSAGSFMHERVVRPFIQLLHDSCNSVQVAALGAISNIVVDFTTRRSIFIQCGGVAQLVQSSKSMDAIIRANALWALRNFIFQAEKKFKEVVFKELTASLLASLVCDPEPFVQEQALALIRNLVDGCIESVDFVFAEDGIIIDAVGRQLKSAMKTEIGIQGMYVLNNVATGKEIHKEAVLQQLLPDANNTNQSCLNRFLQSNDSRLRTAALWTMINLTCSSSPGAFGRLVRFRDAGIVSQIKNMFNDPCLDAKLRVETALTQFMTFGDGST